MTNRGPRVCCRLVAGLAFGLPAFVGTAVCPTVGSTGSPNLTAEPGTSWKNPIPAFADSLHRLDELIELAEFDSAETMSRRLVRELEDSGGGDRVETADVLDQLVEAMFRAGKMAEPEVHRLGERAIKIKERALGPDDLQVAYSVNNFANLLAESGRYLEARPLYERVLLIRQKVLGPDDPQVGIALHNLSYLMWDLGDIESAVKLSERALANWTGALGPRHQLVATSLNLLASLYQEKGAFSEAQLRFERAIEVLTNVFGADHPDVAQARSNLGTILHSVGDYAGARRELERALEIRRAALGPSHPDVARVHINLGELLTSAGDLRGAAHEYSRALEIRETALGPDHADVATSLTVWAGVVADLGEFEEAESLIRRALAIQRAVYAGDHPDIAVTLSHFAVIHGQQRRYREARELGGQVLAMNGSLYGDRHPTTAASMHQLALLDLAAGDLASARERFERTLAIQEELLGPTHPAVAATIEGLAATLLCRGELRAAFDLALRCENIGRDHLRLTARTLPEREVLLYSMARPDGRDVLLSVLSLDPGSSDVRGAWDCVIRSRGLVFDEMARRRRAMETVRTPRVIELESEYRSALDGMIRLLTVTEDQFDAARFGPDLEAARQRKLAAERTLAAESGSFRARQENDRLGFGETVGRLRPSESMVAYVRYDHAVFADDANDRSDRDGSHIPDTEPAYAAFVVTGGREPAFVELGSAAVIDTLVADWGREVARGAPSPWRARHEAAYQEVGDALRRAIWDPVAVRLDSTDRLFVVPDGALHLVALDALPVDSERFVAETDPVLHYLSTERDLVPGIDETAGAGLLALGGPDFGSLSTPEPPSSGRTSSPLSIPASASKADPVGRRSACGDFESLRFDPLAASAVEVEEVVRLWRSRPARGGGAARDAEDVIQLVGPEATETAFRKRCSGKAVLHIATHGFFVGGACPGGAEDLAEQPSRWRLAPIAGESPLLLSGLALAGANERSAAGSGRDDGILTAEEIASLRLDGIEWVVLSACESGVGVVRAGEGVYGLRRAFRLAGARTVIMSMWSIEDDSARRWMERFYTRRLRDGLGTAASVRGASIDILEQRRRDGLSPHPFYWAAFIADGRS